MNQPKPISPLTHFPSLITRITIEVQNATGQTKLHCNRNISALEIISLFSELISINSKALLQQSSMLINSNKQERTADNPLHNFVPCTDNVEICSYCGSHQGNHAAQKTNND